MRIKPACFVLCLFLSGCIYFGRDFSSTAVKTIQSGVTTQREIFNNFGEPDRKGLENGYETWKYFYQYYELSQPAGFQRALYRLR